MKETDRKRVKVAYFRGNGEVYRIEEEYVNGLYSEREIISRVINNLKYSGMDIVILDGGDNVRPLIKPFLYKNDKFMASSRGF